MKTIIAAAAALALGTTVALASEPAKFDGLNIGIHFGQAWGAWDGTLGTTAGCPGQCPSAGYKDHTQSMKGDGVMFGGQIGYSWKLNGIIIGAETDVSMAGIKSSESFATDLYNPYIWDKHHDLKLEYFGTVRGKIGMPMGRFMPYITGGLAWGKSTGTINVDYYPPAALTPLGTSRATADESHMGWTIGGGAEYAIEGGLSVRFEYLYVDLGSADYNFKGGTVFNVKGPAPAPAVPFDTDNFKSDLSLHVLRLGLNYRF